MTTIIFVVTFFTGGTLSYVLPVKDIMILSSVHPAFLPLVIGLLTISGSGLWHDILGSLMQFKQNIAPTTPPAEKVKK